MKFPYALATTESNYPRPGWKFQHLGAVDLVNEPMTGDFVKHDMSWWKVVGRHHDEHGMLLEVRPV